MSQDFIANLEWRFATKKFDPSKTLADQDLDKILKAIQYSPSSYGLQSYHILVLRDQVIKEKIATVSKKQEQPLNCSVLLIFCARTDIYQRIDDYLAVSKKINNYSAEKIIARRDKLRNWADKKSPAELLSWASRQTYIALGFGLAACTHLKIDACPMEGFENEKLHQLLDLPHYFHPLAFLAIGYRAAEPDNKKIRFATDELFTFL